MKTITLKGISYLFLVSLFTLVGCDSGKEEIASLTQKSNQLQEEYQNQLLKTRVVTKSADSLQTVVHSLQRENQKLKGAVPVKTAATSDEKAIEGLVNNLHRGWAEMLETNDTNKLLQYFLDKYTTSAVRINTQNTPSVQRSNNANFEDHLNEIMMTNDLSLSFGQTKFLYTEIKGDIFVTSYRTRLRVYQNNKQAYTSSLVTQLAGQKKNGSWKVGNYNWVTFNYD